MPCFSRFADKPAKCDVALADVNGDGHLDIVAADANGNDVSVLLGNGNGTFKAAQNFATDTTSWRVAVADINGDGHADIVTANKNAQDLSVLLGNGDGTFQAAVNVSCTYAPYGLAVADVNGDGKPDLVTTTVENSSVEVLLGNGDGTFQSPSDFVAGFSPRAVVVADVNGDGRPDLVTALASPSNGVSVLLGNGNGTFSAAHSFLFGSPGSPLAVADVNGDGLPDLICPAYQSDNVAVLLGKRNAATHFLVSAPASVTAGTPFTITVTALTAGGQTDCNYTGTVKFSSSDHSAVLPAAYHFTLADGGVHTFTVTLNTTGKRTITATDKVNKAIMGKATVTVNAGAAQPSPAGGRSSGSATVSASAADGVGAADLASELASARFRDTGAYPPLLSVAGMPAGQQPALAVDAARSRLLADRVHFLDMAGTDGVVSLPPAEDPTPADLRPADLEAFFAVSGV
jgi:hypothetical protein